MEYFEYDVCVVGAGHAGIEASFASSRLGLRTIIFSINLDSIGNCPCSPSIGGTAKGTLVREIDALGGEMGKTTDSCFIHSKILNASKGPSARSLRAQVDKSKYKILMKHKIEEQKNLSVHQCEIVSIYKIGSHWILESHTGMKYKSKSVVLATGTFLSGKTYIGKYSVNSGPDGVFAAEHLTGSIHTLNIPTKKFKTGTSARVLKRSINFGSLEVQKGDEIVLPFSYETKDICSNQMVCHIAWTNDKTKEIILNNIDQSPMYSHKIHAIGPRYCPSIEDKMVRFQKERHQIFVEPCGIDTDEMYLYGMSSCLPEDIQLKFLRSIEGFENIEITRPGYAIEYDIIDPLYIHPTLEVKNNEGLFSAGQINGSSGYEEAAAQGILAGINASMYVLNKKQLILPRSSSYIGTLVDDLTSKGVNDPYRMLTSRSEYRLCIRLDNADERLTPIGREIGLVSNERWNNFQDRIDKIKSEKNKIKRIFIKKEILNEYNLKENISEEAFLKRPEVNYDILRKFDDRLKSVDKKITDRVEIEVKYEGYINLQKKQIEKMKKIEKITIPNGMDYSKILNLRLEAREKLQKVNPMNLLSAQQISGITPADISALTIWIEKLKRERND